MSKLYVDEIENLNGSIKPVKNIVAKVDTIIDLLQIDTSKLETGEQFHVLGYHTRNDGGGGIFYWDADEDKANHNGGTIIDPTQTFPSDWNDPTQQETWFTASGTGNGCWKRVIGDYVTPEMFGAKGDGVTDDTKAIQKVLVLNRKILGRNSYAISDQLLIDKDVDFQNNELVFLNNDAGFWIRPNGKLKNVVINVPDTYTGTVCILKGSDVFGSRLQRTYLKNIYFKNEASTPSGTAIKFEANNDGEHIVWVTVENIQIDRFEYGILLQCKPPIPDGEYYEAYINGNIFKDIKANGVKNLIYFDGYSDLAWDLPCDSGYGCAVINQNTFDNIEIQTTTNVEYILYVNETAGNNFFTNFRTFDLSTSSYSTNFVVKGYNNLLHGLFALVRCDIDYSKGNTIIQTYQESVFGQIISLLQGTGTNTVLKSKVAGNSYDRFYIRADGRLYWGNGSSDPDTYIRKEYDIKGLVLDGRITNEDVITFPDGDTTPSVADSNIFKTNNSSATSITHFVDSRKGLEITIIFGDSNTTIVHGSGIYTKSGANVTPSANTTMKFVYDGSYWYEV